MTELSPEPGRAPLTDHHSFVSRHIGPTAVDATAMARALGFDSLDAVIDATIPESIRLRRPLALGAGRASSKR